MNGSLPSDGAAYLDALRRELADLPVEERDELLAEVEGSLLAAAADGDANASARLGPPDRFAAELRAAAGLAPPAGDSFLGALRRAFETPRARVALHGLRRLAPVWWVVRAYVLVAALVLAAGGHWSLSHPSIPHVVDGRGGVAALAVAIVVSVALGLRGAGSTEGRRALAVANVVLLAAAVPVLQHVRHGAPVTGPQSVEFVSEPVGGVAVNGTPVRNIYAYSRDGRLLHDVLLFDADGNPLNVGGPNAPDPNRRVLVTTGGARLYNTFPIRYFDPGTKRVRHPNAGAPVRAPRVLTPPLRLRRGR